MRSLVNYISGLGLSVLDHSRNNSINFKLTREKFKELYITLTKNLSEEGNSLFEIIENICAKTKLSPLMVSAVILVSEELGFYNIIKTDAGVKVSVNTNSKKRMLDESKIYKKIS